MRSVAPPLAPTFRSAMQGRLLAAVLLDPKREWTVTELAEHVDAPLTSVQSEVTRLIGGHILSDRKVGRTRVVRPHPSNPAVPPLTQLTLVTFGPPHVIAREFAGLDAQQVIIFGSWAQRYAGTPGSPPRDIDVLVVGDVPREPAYAAARQAEAALGIDVNPVIRSSQAWADPASDPLLDQIVRRDYVTVLKEAS